MIDYIVEGLCLLLCVLHLLHNFLSVRSLSKKVDSCCALCGAPVSKGEVHKCDLSPSQVEALYNFVLSLKSSSGDSNVE